MSISERRMPPPPAHLIVGLGNPDAEYAHTRHNVGFMVAEALAEHYHCQPWKKKFKGLLTGCDAPPFLLLKPQTYMNLSGESVAEALRFHKMTPAQVIVFHDDLDLNPAQIKIKQGGGAGGHNGLKSIDAHIGKDYWRVRIGIGRPVTAASHPNKDEAVSNYVLGNFAKADQAWLTPLLAAMATESSLLLNGKRDEYLARLMP